MLQHQVQQTQVAEERVSPGGAVKDCTDYHTNEFFFPRWLGSWSSFGWGQTLTGDSRGVGQLEAIQPEHVIRVSHQAKRVPSRLSVFRPDGQDP